MDRQTSSYKKKIYTVAALVVLIIVSISGCTDKPEEVQDEVNIYVYEQTGKEGDPQEQIREFYDMVDEQSGLPVLVPLRKHAAEYELDPETGQVIPDTIKIYDPDGNPVDRETALAMQDNIARDEAGNIITDAAKLDIHIEEIGKNNYQINNLRQEMQVEDGVWTISYDAPHEYGGRTKFNDNIIKTAEPEEITIGSQKITGLDKIADHDDMYGCFVRGEDGEPYAAIFVDEDSFRLYPRIFRVDAYDGEHAIRVADCTHMGGGIYLYLYPLQEVPDGRVDVSSCHDTGKYYDDIVKRGGFARFSFIKK